MAGANALQAVIRLGARSAGAAPIPADLPPPQRIADVRMAGLPVPGHRVLPRGASRLALCCGDLGDGRGGRWVSGLQRLAAFCAGQGLATLQFALLSAVERTLPTASIDADLPTQRLAWALTWAKNQSNLAALRLGLLGAAPGAAAALGVAAARPGQVAAVVACAGRLDLLVRQLVQMSAPRLLVVAADDLALLAINRAALLQLGGRRRLEIVPGSVLLLNEPRALATVSALA
jgi:putative phosphoribosyl transferase